MPNTEERHIMLLDITLFNMLLDMLHNMMLDTDPRSVATPGILHCEQEHKCNIISRSIFYGTKSLTISQLIYSSPKLEMNADFYIIEEIYSYLAGNEFTRIADIDPTSG